MSSLDPYSLLSRVYQLTRARNNLTEQLALRSKLPMKICKSNMLPGSCVFCDDIHNLRSMHQNNGTEENFTKMLLNCYNIEVTGSDSGDNELDICERCADRLRDASSFRSQVESAGKILEEPFIDGSIEDDDKNIKQNTNKTKIILMSNINSNSNGNYMTKNEKFQLTTASDDDNLDYDNSDDNLVIITSASDDDFYWREQCDRGDNEKEPNTDRQEERVPPLHLSAKKCPVCDKRFTARHYLRKHFVRHFKKKLDEKKEDSAPPLDPSTKSCPVCLKNFTSCNFLRKHYSTHFKNFLCDVCGFACKCKSTLKIHLSTHSIVAKYSCHICGKNYKSKQLLTGHIKGVHKKIHTLYQCHVCMEKFKHYYMRIKHLKTQHGVENRTFKCEPCGKVFSRYSRMTDHFKNFHQNIKNHQCQQCSMQFFSKQQLTDHMVVHSDVKNFHCETCGKSYARKKTLTEHLKIHANIRAHKCEYCEKAFVQKCSLKGHLRTHVNVKADTATT